MPRSTNINTYSTADRALVSGKFYASLAGGSATLKFAVEKDAKRTYFRILAVLNAARHTGTPSEQNYATMIGVRQATAVMHEASGQVEWVVEIYDKVASFATDPVANMIKDRCNGDLPLPDEWADGGGPSPDEAWASAADATANALGKLGYADRPPANPPAPAADAGGLGAHPPTPDQPSPDEVDEIIRRAQEAAAKRASGGA